MTMRCPATLGGSFAWRCRGRRGRRRRGCRGRRRAKTSNGQVAVVLPQEAQEALVLVFANVEELADILVLRLAALESDLNDLPQILAGQIVGLEHRVDDGPEGFAALEQAC